MVQAGSIFPQYSGSVSGVLTAAGGIGGMLMPLSMGVVSEHSGLQVGFIVPLFLEDEIRDTLLFGELQGLFFKETE